MPAAGLDMICGMPARCSSSGDSRVRDESPAKEDSCSFSPLMPSMPSAWPCQHAESDYVFGFAAARLITGLAFHECMGADMRCRQHHLLPHVAEMTCHVHYAEYR